MNPLSAWRRARARRLERRVARAALAAEDAELARTGRVGAALFARFGDAYGYGTATPMSWLINRLRVLHRRVREGGTLELHEPGGVPLVVAADGGEAVFLAWIERYFPDLTPEHLNKEA
ncbi:MAG: hypothetical protein MK005_13775 [Alcanivorax sp.]|nr:hypothetical protein [Alcanivorax sp.]